MRSGGTPIMVLHIALGGLGDRDHAVGAHQAAAEAEAPQLHAEVRECSSSKKRFAMSWIVTTYGRIISSGTRFSGMCTRSGESPRRNIGKRDVIEAAVIAARVDGGPEFSGSPASVRTSAGPLTRVYWLSVSMRAQRVDQASDVGADAEVPDAPGVDDDVQRHSYARTASSFQL